MGDEEVRIDAVMVLLKGLEDVLQAHKYENAAAEFNAAAKVLCNALALRILIQEKVEGRRVNVKKVLGFFSEYLERNEQLLISRGADGGVVIKAPNEISH